MRQKPKAVKIESLEQANEALREIALNEIRLRQIDARANEEIAKVKSEAEKEGKESRERIAILGNALAIYAEYEKDDLFSKKKTVALTFGDFGFRKSTKVSIKKITLDLLKKLGYADAIRTKETVNKDELKKWPKEKLTQVGAKLAEEDVFFYETNKEKVNEDILRSA